MEEEKPKTTAGKKYPSEVISRREIVDYPSLTEERRVIHLIVRYEDLPPLIVDIPKEEYSPEKEDEIVDQVVEAELKRLGRI